MGEVLSTEQAAGYLQLSVETVKRKARAGDLPAAKAGRQWRFRREDLDAWLASGGDREEAAVDRGLAALVRERMAAGEETVSLAELKARLGL